MAQYEIQTVGNTGSIEVTREYGVNPQSAFAKLYPSVRLIPATKDTATICIRLLDGKRRTTNYYNGETQVIAKQKKEPLFKISYVHGGPPSVVQGKDHLSAFKKDYIDTMGRKYWKERVEPFLREVPERYKEFTIEGDGVTKYYRQTWTEELGAQGYMREWLSFRNNFLQV